MAYKLLKKKVFAVFQKYVKVTYDDAHLKKVVVVTYLSLLKLLSTQYDFVLAAVRRSSYARAPSGLLVMSVGSLIRK